MTEQPFPISEEQIATTLQALKSNEFLAFFVPEAAEAKQMVLDAVEEGAWVGLGGSQTLRQMNLPEALNEKGVKLLDHWDPVLSEEESMQCRRDQLHCDLFLASVNAVTETGELVSCDGIGNRIAATTFGPGKVMLLT